MHGERKAGVTARNFAVEDELWEAAKVKAASEGRALSGVIREFLREWTGRAVTMPTEREEMK